MLPRTRILDTYSLILICEMKETGENRLTQFDIGQFVTKCIHRGPGVPPGLKAGLHAGRQIG